MRKAAVLAALLVSSTAWAASGSTKDSKSASSTRATARGQGTGSAQASDANALPGATERDQLSKDDFNLKGKVGRVSARSVTIDRDKSTPATLMIDQATKIEVDGKAAKAADLKPGDDVKASFNLRGERPIAVDLKASSKSK